MSDTLCRGISRRVQAFAYDRETQEALSYLVEEARQPGLAAASAIVEFALGEEGMAWSQAPGVVGKTTGQDAQELQAVAEYGGDDDARGEDLGEDNIDLELDDSEYPPIDPSDDDGAMAIPGLGDDDEVDLSDLDDALDDLESGLDDSGDDGEDDGEEDDGLSEAGLLFPGEIAVY